MAKKFLFLKHPSDYIIGSIIGIAVLWGLFIYLFTPFIDTPFGVIFTPSFSTCGNIPSDNNFRTVNESSLSSKDFGIITCFYQANLRHIATTFIYQSNGIDSSSKLVYYTDTTGHITLTSSGSFSPHSGKQSSFSCQSISLSANTYTINCGTALIHYTEAPFTLSIFGATI